MVEPSIWDEMPEKVDIPKIGLYYDAFEEDAWRAKARAEYEKLLARLKNLENL